MAPKAHFLAVELLFLRLPPSSPSLNITINHFLAAIETILNASASSPDYTQLIDNTYYLLRNGDFSTEELLLIWEIRLNLFMFNNQISFAKKEAINLNNSLYTNENKTSNKETNPSQSSLSLSHSNINQDGQLLLPIYPLPKNNDGKIGNNLLVLILRLKSIPNMHLVNELFKLCYQLRLRGTNQNQNDDLSTKTKLINLSYEVVVILTITKNYSTLLNYLGSIMHDLKNRLEKSTEEDDEYKQYYSNIKLVWLITKFTLATTNNSQVEHIKEEHQKDFEEIDQSSIDSLVYVLQNIAPVYASATSMPLVHASIRLAEDVARHVEEGKITGRIICSILGLWDISNVYKAHLEDDGKLAFVIDSIEDDNRSALQTAYRLITSKWCNYVHKVYGLE